MNQIELLSPAGDIDKMKAALIGGADAVYLAGRAFGARKFAGNFSESELAEAVRYAHLRGKQVYVTVNTMYFEDEVEKVLDFLRFLHEIQVDAVIVQDLMLIRMVMERFPGLELHASTQMGIHSGRGASWAQRQGFDRVVLAREVSFEDALRISQILDVEVFIHGALCVSYSGQCLMSSLIGGRSGNRGACAQPCRKRYKLIGKDGQVVNSLIGDYLLSPKDLRTSDEISRIAKSHLTSLKIEGRMKSPQYAFATAHHYRSLLDGEEPEFDPAAIFNREETPGRLFGSPDKAWINPLSPENHGVVVGRVRAFEDRRLTLDTDRMLNPGDEVKVIRREGSIGGRIERRLHGNSYKVNTRHQFKVGEEVRLTYDTALIAKIDARLNREEGGIPVRMRFEASLKGGMKLNLSVGRMRVEVLRPEGVEQAQKSGLSAEDAQKQLAKLGDSVYALDAFECDLEPDLFIRKSDLNAMRREALEKMDEMRLGAYEAPQEIEDIEERRSPRRQPVKHELAVEVVNLDQLKAAVAEGADAIYYGDIDTLKDALKLCPELIPVLPEITMSSEFAGIDSGLKEADYAGPLMVRTLGQLQHYQAKHEIETDVTFNIANSHSFELLESEGVYRISLSEELSHEQIDKMLAWGAAEVALVVYGHQRAMITEYCPVRGMDECGNCSLEGSVLEDEKGYRFPLMRAPGCRMKVLNSRKLNLIGKVDQLLALPVDQYRLRMTVESAEEVSKVIHNYKKALSGEPYDRISDEVTTLGHFIRGVKE